MSPTPFSLLCALLLTLPLAIVFTITTPPTGAHTTTTILPTPSSITTTTNDNASGDDEFIFDTSITLPTIQEILINQTTATSISPPPAPPLPLPLPLPTITESPPPVIQIQEEDDEEDKALFRLASRVNPYPSSSPRKLAFLFLTTTPLPVAPLWELFFNQTNKNMYNIYIHADPSFNYTPPFTGVFFNRTIPSKPTRRHSPTLIAAQRRLLANALLDDPANYMFALISSSCIPLHSFSFTYKYLISSRKSFIEILKNERGAWGRWVARGEHAMLPEVTLESFRIGSQFSVLTRKHARTVVSDTRVWSKFNQPCVHDHMNKCYPEENYFPTLISMVYPRGSVPATLTHVDWNGHFDGHPHTYHAMDVGPELISKLRSDKPRYGDDGSNGSDSAVREREVRFMFARKFGADTVKPLLEIAKDFILEE